MTPADTPAPRVSIVTIFFNAESFFVEAIESVLAQSFGDWELLLCDDGSRDGSTGIAQDYAARFGPKVRHLQHPGHENRGMSATRNLGIAEARGELMAFIDADDVWRPDKLAEQVAIMDAHPEVALLCGTVNYWRSWSGGRDELIPTGPELDRVMAPPSTLLGIYPLGRAPAPCPSDMMLRTEAVCAVGGFVTDFPGMYEDQAFLVKIYLAYPAWFSRAVWLDYRQHPQSCVAQSHGGGGNYHEVRATFLRWFRGYIAAQPRAADPRVLRAIRRAAVRTWGAGLRSARPRPRRAAGRLWRGLKRRIVPSRSGR